MRTHWRITMFGELVAQCGDAAPARFETRQTAALLSYLAFHPNRTHSREVLAEQLWPEEDPEATRSRLRTALWALRRILEADETPAGSVLLTERAEVGLAPGSFTTDIAEFEQAVRTVKTTRDEKERADSLCRAVALYAGDLLPGCYEEWVAPERERLAEAYAKAGNPRKARSTWQKAATQRQAAGAKPNPRVLALRSRALAAS